MKAVTTPAGPTGRPAVSSRMVEVASEHAAPEHAYVFDNSAVQATARFSALAAIFDPGTVYHLVSTGVANGWKCLEVGGGGGSIASWLCDRVGVEGRVLATDLDTRFLEKLAHPNLEILRHDIVKDSLPEAAFDLVHARLVLAHLPDRDKVLRRMVEALSPGGWLVVEEFDALSLQADPTISPTERPLKAFSAMRAVMANHGVDLLCGRRLATRVRALGLPDVVAEGRAFMFQGRSTGIDLFRASAQQLRDEMFASGLISEAEFARDMNLLDSPDLLIPSPVMWAVKGRRPAAG
jgi:2-polyprenyl-3-methyl-5-hydroxy-6-metoxy-1,4-benzoquinol methylase